MTPEDRAARFQAIADQRARLQAAKAPAVTRYNAALAALAEAKAPLLEITAALERLRQESEALGQGEVLDWARYIFTRDDFETTKMAIGERLQVTSGAEHKALLRDLQALKEHVGRRPYVPGAKPRCNPYLPPVADLDKAKANLGLLPERARRVMAYRLAATMAGM